MQSYGSTPQRNASSNAKAPAKKPAPTGMLARKPKQAAK